MKCDKNSKASVKLSAARYKQAKANPVRIQETKRARERWTFSYIDDQKFLHGSAKAEK